MAIGRIGWLFLLFSLQLLFSTTSAWAHEDSVSLEKPLWELGIGGGGVWAPDYPGSDQVHFWGIPFPWGVYRGEILHSDRRGGTRARLFKGAHYEFNLSAAGGLPSSSQHNVARHGMPNLEWLGEAGPRLMLDLFTAPDGSFLRFGLPLRVAFSSNGQHLRDHGLILAPELLYDHPDIFHSSIDAFALLTVNFADRRFGDYFYSVDPDYATPTRPTYRAREGYLLSDLSLGLAAPLNRADLRLFLFGSIESLHGSANEHSPLVRTSLDSSVSLVFLWVFAKSSEHVKPED